MHSAYDGLSPSQRFQICDEVRLIVGGKRALKRRHAVAALVDLVTHGGLFQSFEKELESRTVLTFFAVSVMALRALFIEYLVALIGIGFGLCKRSGGEDHAEQKPHSLIIELANMNIEEKNVSEKTLADIE